jgi:hypothetical protein
LLLWVCNSRTPMDNFPGGCNCNTDLFLTKKGNNLRHPSTSKIAWMQGPDRVLRPISELIVCEGHLWPFIGLMVQDQQRDGKHLACGIVPQYLRPGYVMVGRGWSSWFWTLSDIDLVEKCMRNYGRGGDEMNSWDEANVASKRKGALYGRIQPSLLSLHPCADAPIRACHASCFCSRFRTVGWSWWKARADARPPSPSIFSRCPIPLQSTKTRRPRSRDVRRGSKRKPTRKGI